MSNYAFELQRAIVQKLLQSGPLMAMVNDRVFKKVPENAGFPRIEYGAVDATADNFDCIVSYIAFVPLHVWSNTFGNEEALEIAGMIRNILHEEELSLGSDFRLQSLEHDTDRFLTDPDGATIHAVVTFRAMIDELPLVTEGVADEPYIADAVHWDGTSYLTNPALNAGEHDQLSFALWFQIPSPLLFSIHGFWITAPDVFNFSYGEAINSGGGNGGMQFTLVDADGVTYLAEVNVNGAGTAPDLDRWYCYMGSADCSSNLGKIVAYLNDVDYTEDVGNPVSNGGGPGSIIQGDGVEMRIGVPDPPPLVRGDLDMANFMMWYGQAIDWSIESNRRFIIDDDGKPVDPALAIAEFGTPTVALIGDATAFQTNQGSGGPFTVNGVITNATTSPSD